MPVTLITPQLAKEYQSRSVLARKANAQARALASVMDPQPEPVIADSIPDYATRRLARVRVMLDQLDEELERLSRRPHDSKRFKELTEAQAKLADQERILSGRPLPGSRRPKPEREPKAQPTVLEPQIPTEPQPVGQDTQTN